MRIWIVKRGSVSVTPICTLIDSSVFMRIAVRYHRRDRGTRASSRERKREREDIPLLYHTRASPENRVTSDSRWNLRLTFHPSRIEEVKTNFSLFAARSIEEMNGRILVSIFHHSAPLDPRFRYYPAENRYRNWPALMYGPAGIGREHYAITRANSDTCARRG